MIQSTFTIGLLNTKLKKNARSLVKTLKRYGLLLGSRNLVVKIALIGMNQPISLLFIIAGVYFMDRLHFMTFTIYRTVLILA